MREQRRALVKQMFDQGMSDYDMAAEFGIASAGVSSARSQYNKTGYIVALGMRSDKKTVNHNCVDCGCNLGKPGTIRCHPCNIELQRGANRVKRQPFIDKLVAWADQTGRVPSSDEAQLILNMSRSRAADYVVHAFGPDPRNGYHTRFPRPYNPGVNQHANL
jgi:hypothetical protein